LAHLGLVRVVMHAERVLAGLRQREALLGDDRPDDHLCCLHQAAASSVTRARGAGAVASATSVGRAASETSSDAAPTRSATPVSSTGSASSRLMLRNDMPAAAS